MTIGAIPGNAIAIIKLYEGLELESYQDIAGVWTIGYGHTETARAGQTITREQADDLLRTDLNSRFASLRGWSAKHKVILNENEESALLSFIFNVSFASFESSTAARRLIGGDRIGAADALTWWNKARVNGNLREVLGLTRRRAAEKALFLTPPTGETPNNPDKPGFTARETTNVRPSPRCDNWPSMFLPTRPDSL